MVRCGSKSPELQFSGTLSSATSFIIGDSSRFTFVCSRSRFQALMVQARTSNRRQCEGRFRNEQLVKTESGYSPNHPQHHRGTRGRGHDLYTVARHGRSNARDGNLSALVSAYARLAFHPGDSISADLWRCRRLHHCLAGTCSTNETRNRVGDCRSGAEFGRRHGNLER